VLRIHSCVLLNPSPAVHTSITLDTPHLWTPLTSAGLCFSGHIVRMRQGTRLVASLGRRRPYDHENIPSCAHRYGSPLACQYIGHLPCLRHTFRLNPQPTSLYPRKRPDQVNCHSKLCMCNLRALCMAAQSMGTLQFQWHHLRSCPKTTIVLGRGLLLGSWDKRHSRSSHDDSSEDCSPDAHESA